MRISDVTCTSCTSVYQVAESLSAQGSPGRAECTVCGNFLESWQEPKLRAYRLVMPLKHKYKPIPAPPSPADLRAGGRAISALFAAAKQVNGRTWRGARITLFVREEDRPTWLN